MDRVLMRIIIILLMLYRGSNVYATPIIVNEIEHNIETILSNNYNLVSLKDARKLFNINIVKYNERIEIDSNLVMYKDRGDYRIRGMKEDILYTEVTPISHERVDYIPLRLVAEHLGYTIESKNGKINIQSSNMIRHSESSGDLISYTKEVYKDWLILDYLDSVSVRLLNNTVVNYNNMKKHKIYDSMGIGLKIESAIHDIKISNYVIREYGHILELGEYVSCVVGVAEQSLKILENKEQYNSLKTKKSRVELSNSYIKFRGKLDVMRVEYREELKSLGSLLDTRGLSINGVISGSDLIETISDKEMNEIDRAYNHLSDDLIPLLNQLNSKGSGNGLMEVREKLFNYMNIDLNTKITGYDQFEYYKIKREYDVRESIIVNELVHNIYFNIIVITESKLNNDIIEELGATARLWHNRDLLNSIFNVTIKKNLDIK